ncbi:ATP-binding protein [Rubritalea sp.]|uniref:ATP-binding protein n=1 Tax=Rubritalea sp. TaxID=2109375 RepID=UPI003EF691D0
MIDAIPFKTRARTIDHLGREQIADCPTAISELWKNAYDAYARNVRLDIFNGPEPVTVISDDGHGMSLEEIREKWLVVGTESKTSKLSTPSKDRNGLAIRPRQGQKGIGRLSCGYLGSLLLLVSKRKNFDYSVVLVDWRLFENPFLLLQDIQIPIATFTKKEDILPALDKMRDHLMSNIWGNNDDETRSLRIQEAWAQFTQLEESDDNSKKLGFKTTQQELEETIISNSFSEHHFKKFPVWNGRHSSGTALLVSALDDSLENILRRDEDSISKQTHKIFFETLTGFADPFVKKNNAEDQKLTEFNYSASSWDGETQDILVGPRKEFSLEDLLHLEHIIDGRVDANGVFRGRVKSFGNWLEGEITIDLQEKNILGKRIDTRLGPFDIFIATAEWELMSTTHTKEELGKIQSMAKLYAGFMIYRDSLRVMPYGRPDNDFFEIEQRRSKRAGTEFWNHRRMFGKVAISKSLNPNLRDKAGREGLVDNRAAKTLKDIVTNILMESARRFFGSSSDIRKATLPLLQKAHKEVRLAEQNKKLRAQQRKKFNANLGRFLRDISRDYEDLRVLEDKIATPPELNTTEIVDEYREHLQGIRNRLGKYTLGSAPKKLGTKEEDYKDFRYLKSKCQNISSELTVILNTAVEKLNPKSGKEIAYSDLQRQARFIHQRTGLWNKKIQKLLEHESSRISEFVSERNKALHKEFLPVLDDVESGRIELAKALAQIEDRREKLDWENEEIFDPYISTLECLQERIDLSGVAVSAAEEAADLLSQLNNLNELAQLGITVELVGHELETFDTTIGDGLNRLDEKSKSSSAYSQIKHSYEGLSDRLRFLSPLKLSGDRNRTWLSGKEIYSYVEDFFSTALKGYNINLTATSSFLNFKVYDLPSRILPVFLNLVNNSIYWVNQTEENRRITLGVCEDKIVIGDSGPGVHETDQPRLFTLFFSKKIRDGRGVGLYLCRANLAASGHRIEYITNKKSSIEEGANFAITFKGGIYGDL